MISPMNRLIALLLLALTGLTACDQPDRQPPVLDFTISPPIGDSVTVFRFDAAAVTDNSTPLWQMKVRWDFNQDNQWDTDYSIKKEFSHRFPGNGRYSVTCEAIDESGNTTLHAAEVIVMPVPRDSQFTDPRDRHQYRSVLLFDRWWMADNLLYGKSLTRDDKPVDDAVPEYYYLPDTLSYGGYYTWAEATLNGSDTSRGVCPPGWRLPRPEDVDALNDIASIGDQAERYLFGDGWLGTGFQQSGRYITYASLWDGQSKFFSIWVNQATRGDANRAWMIWLKSAITKRFIVSNVSGPGAEYTEGWPREWGIFSYKKVALPVRCLKDLAK